MLYHYLIITYRNLSRNKFYSFVNILGLAVGICCSLLILLHIEGEFNFDTFYPNYDKIWRISADYKNRKMAAFPPNQEENLQKTFPEIQKITRLLPTEGTILGTAKASVFSNDVFFADSSYFDVFKQVFISGNPQNALQSPFSIVLTQSLAKELFGENDPIGKMISLRSTNAFRYDGQHQVTAIIADLPKNTHLPFKALISWNKDDRLLGISWTYTYLRFQEKANINSFIFNKQFDEKWGKNNQQNDIKTLDFKPILMNVASIHLHSKLLSEPYPTGNLNYLYVFFMVSGFIMLVACINYINLNTARAVQRIKEIGVRKVLGASKMSFIWQFVVEAFVMATISFFIAFSLCEISLPFFGNIVEKPLSLNVLYASWKNILGFGVFFLFIVLFSSVYPALYMSNFKLLDAIKGNANKNKISLRKILIVLQFTITIITLVGTGIVYQQINFLHFQNLGFQKSNILVVRLPKNVLEEEKLAQIKKELLQNQHILKVGSSVEIPGTNFTSQFLFEVENQQNNQQKNNKSNKKQQNKTFKKELLGRLMIGDDFLETLDIQLIDGEKIIQTQENNTEKKFLLNEIAAQKLGYCDNGNSPIGKEIIIARDSAGAASVGGTVVGVVKNFNFSSLHTAIAPMVIIYSNQTGNLFLNVETQYIQQIENYLERIWAKNVSGEPLSYFFLDENFDKHYKQEEKLGELLLYFSVLSIFISCLGLFGLALFSSELRTKEVGIRKILGASTLNIILLLSKDFIWLVLIAIGLALPLGYYIISHWLDNFAYKTEIQWSLFAFAGVVALFSAILPLILQAFIIAISAPIHALRTE